MRYVDEDDSVLDENDSDLDEKQNDEGDFDDIAAIENGDDPRLKRLRMLEELQRREDEEYAREWGYSIVKALRGATVGRRLKRKLFKFGMIELVSGFALTVLTFLERNNFKYTHQFDERNYGATLIDLNGVVGVPTLLMGICTLAAVRHWGTLVTNRRLLSNLMRLYTLIFVILFAISLWFACAVLLTFGKVKDWSSDVTLATMRPYYICILIFLMPLLLAMFLYTMDVSYLTDEVERGGFIGEPDPPSYTRDLSDVTFFQSMIYICGVPIILCIQCNDLFSAMMQSYNNNPRQSSACCRIPCFEWFRERTVPAGAPPKKKRQKTIWTRIWRTLIRCFARSKPRKVDQQPSALVEVDKLPLKALESEREKEERLQREKLMQSQEAERVKIAQKEAEDAMAYQRKQDEEMRRIEEERLRLQQEADAKRQAEEFASRWQSVLAVADFKSLWPVFSTNGSFQCNLKVMPTPQALTDHLKKQGFHIVFSLTPSANELEIGICNIRPVGQASWFLARFLVSNNTFSAVMKSDNPDLVPILVKKFALAKVLKIDTPGAK